MSDPNPAIEIVSQPFTLWVAPSGTAFPAVDEVPSAPWVKVGGGGDLNYSMKEGVKIHHVGTHQVIVPLGASGPRAASRSGDEWRISVTLVDLTLEQYSLVLAQKTPTTVAPGPGTAGYRTLGLSRGISVLPRLALLVRGDGASPYGEGWNLQYEIPRAVQVADAVDIPFVRGAQAGLLLEWLALEDTDKTFGRIVAQDSDATT